MNSSVSKLGVALLALLLSFGVFGAVNAQDGNSRAGGQDGLVSEETLSTSTFDVQTAGARKVTLARLTLTEHGTVRLAASAEPSLFFLEQGSWEIHLDNNSGMMTSASPVFVNGTPLVPGATVSLGPGGWLSLSPRSTVNVSNLDSAPAQSLSLTFSDRSTATDGNGATWQSLGDPVEVEAGTNRITFARLTLDPGATMAPQVTSGPTVFDMRSGSVILLLNPGDVQISRAGGGNEVVTAGYVDPSTLHADVDDLDPKADDAIGEPPGTPMAGTAVGLGAGDGAVLKSGATQALRVTDETTAVVLVLTISPAESDS
jgi:hypothetical protein